MNICSGVKCIDLNCLHMDSLLGCIANMKVILGETSHFTDCSTHISSKVQEDYNKCYISYLDAAVCRIF